MTEKVINRPMERLILVAGLVALGYIILVMGGLGWEFFTTHPHGPFQYDVFGLFFLVLFGPGTAVLIASAVIFATKRSFPTWLQVGAMLGAVWVGFTHAALGGISV